MSCDEFFPWYTKNLEVFIQITDATAPLIGAGGKSMNN
jgi:hypothetical protein